MSKKRVWFTMHTNVLMEETYYIDVVSDEHLDSIISLSKGDLWDLWASNDAVMADSEQIDVIGITLKDMEITENKHD